MRNLKWWLLALALFAPAVYALSGNTAATDNVRARLLSEQNSIAPGQSIWVALELDIRDGWHTYWRNPGDSGQATQIAWSLPSGLTAGGIEWTTPHRFVVAPLVNYGYAKHAMHLVKITASPDLKTSAPLDLRAKASWLVCSDVCIPESADLDLKLPVTAAGGPKDAAVAQLFDGARAELPGAAPAASSAKIVDGQLVITLGKEWGGTLSRIKSLAFYPFDDGVIEYAAPQTLTRRDGALDLALKLGYQPPRSGDVRGVLIATEDTGAPGQKGAEAIEVPIEIAATLSGAPAPASAAGPRFAPAATAATAAPAAPAVAPTKARGLVAIMLLAVLGGLILNLMPCVFPVLSIKAIGLVAQAKTDPAAVRAKGLMFAAGVIASMLLLAGVLLGLRAGGEEIGWGFQLQSPLFVTFMVYLLLAVGLNLSGVFEVGGGLAGVGDSLTHGDGLRASFFTGVLTTLVATPCSAPFMAAAVGWALTQSAAVALCIFAALGAGLSLPYLALSFAPWLRRALPKPGAWMDTMKQVFAFPMYASAAWLLWVLAQQTSSLGLGAALAGALLVAFAAWAYQKSKGSTAAGRLTAIGSAAAAVVLAIALPVRLASVATAAPVAASAAAGESWQPYDAARVKELEASGAPLLVNFTASWCLTCLVNERNAFADPAVLEVFREKGVTLMKGDWTNRDTAITEALAHFGRAGVPLYVVYNGKPGSSEPVVLPQLLSAGVVESAFAALPNRDSK